MNFDKLYCEDMFINGMEFSGIYLINKSMVVCCYNNETQNMAPGHKEPGSTTRLRTYTILKYKIFFVVFLPQKNSIIHKYYRAKTIYRLFSFRFLRSQGGKGASGCLRLCSFREFRSRRFRRRHPDISRHCYSR